MSAPRSTRIVAYRRRASPLHAARATIAACYCAALAACALITENPLLLCALLLATLAAGSLAAGVSREILRSLRLSAPVMLGAIVLINLLVSRGGLTVFARLGDWGVLGQVNLTLEALVYGLVFALRMLIVLLACLLAVCAADPDELLAFCRRRISPRSALTATLATRMIPVLAEDARRLTEAQRCRGDGGPQGARARLEIVRATVAGALERSLDLAAVLELRGYGSPRRRRAPNRALSRHDLAFAASAAAMLALYVLIALDGCAPFHAYPLLSVRASPLVFALGAVTVVLALAPFADRLGIEP